MVYFSLGDLFGFLSLIFVVLSAVLIAQKNHLIKKRLLVGPLNPRRHLRRRRIKGRLLYLTNLMFVRRSHVITAMLGGFFLVLHVAYLISYPMNGAIILGYVAVAAAAFLGVTGTSFLQKFREARYFHGSISLSAIALMAIHAAGSAFNIPVWIASAALAVTVCLVFTVTARHVRKLVI